MLESSHIALSAQDDGQDRIQILRDDDKVIIAIADGAGGRSGGAEAAELAMKLISQHAPLLATQTDCEKLLVEIDRAISADKIAGETTAIVIVVSASGVIGASVGDSGAWIISRAGIDELTRSQTRKPFLGAGVAIVTGFARNAFNGTLLVATDGLLKYTSREAIASVVEESNFNETPAALVKLVRYASGNLPDDVAIGLCRSI
jgi:serine/threonine protein phosphatase PrpC